MNAGEHVQAMILIAFERVPSRLRTPFAQSHPAVTVTRVIKQTTTLGRVTYEVHFVDRSGQPGQEVLHGAPRRDWAR